MINGPFDCGFRIAGFGLKGIAVFASDRVVMHPKIETKVMKLRARSYKFCESSRSAPSPGPSVDGPPLSRRERAERRRECQYVLQIQQILNPHSEIHNCAASAPDHLHTQEVRRARNA